MKNSKFRQCHSHLVCLLVLWVVIIGVTGCSVKLRYHNTNIIFNSKQFSELKGITQQTQTATHTHSMVMSMPIFIFAGKENGLNLSTMKYLSYQNCRPTNRSVKLTNIMIIINPLNTKRRLLYLKTQFVPRCKHFSSRL